MGVDDHYLSKKKRKRKVIHVMPLNLAPLIDINANLLFFLIIANSVQEDRLKAGEKIELAPSTSQMAEAGDLISLVVGLDELSVNELVIMNLTKGEFKPEDFDPKAEDRIVKLYTNLTQRYQDLVKKGATPGVVTEGNDDKLPVVLIQVDKRLPYSTVKKVMRTCGEAGFSKFRFGAKQK